jgi:hypothetical protein
MERSKNEWRVFDPDRYLRRIRDALLIAGVVCLVAACGSGGGGGGSTAGTTGGGTAGSFPLSGQAQKGPFILGSSIFVSELDTALNPNGKIYAGQTRDDLGNFVIGSNVGSSVIELIGDGFYMDELTGNISPARVTLRAVADLTVSPSPIINILTTLQEPRLKNLILQGQTYQAAMQQSQVEALAVFGIDATKITSFSALAAMQITGTTDQDSALLAASAILARMSTNAATANGSSQAAEMSFYLSRIATAISSSGVLGDAAIIAARNLAATQLDLAAIRTNIETYYANRGVTVVAPKFEEWVDKDGSGVLPRRLVAVSGLTFSNSPAADPGLLITSNVVSVTGFGSGVSVPVTVSSGATIIKNNAAVSGTVSSAQNGDTLAFRITSPDYGASTTVTIAVGSTTVTWRIETRPPAPFDVFAVSGIGQVTVSWAPVPAATSYNIYWGTAPGLTTASTKIAGATSPTVQSGLASGTTYYYRVGAVGAGGETLSAETFSFVYPGGNPTGVFTATGNMTTARFIHTSTLVPANAVLITGGVGSTGVNSLGSAEIYNPITGLFSATGSMTASRINHRATSLPGGKILITGGYSNSTSSAQNPIPDVPLASAEIYDPATGAFTATGSMSVARYAHAATLLPNGKVLVMGGVNGPTHHSSAEIYDPATGMFTATGSMTVARTDNNFVATLLPNGKVLIGGGVSTANIPLASAELYDPATGVFTATGSMTTTRYGNSVALLPNGKVLFAGGANAGNTNLASAEIYDPATGLFSATGGMTTARYLSAVTLLSNGKVLIAGGANSATAEIYDFATDIFTATGGMAGTRIQFTATTLPNGKVLAAGGNTATGAELFQ